jgi:hypothetical protein
LRIFSREANFSFVFIQLVPDGSSWETNEKFASREKNRKWKTGINHVKNQSRGHTKKVECSSTFMACPRAVRRTKNSQVRQLERKLSNVRSARAGKATAMAIDLKVAQYTF